MSQEKYIGMDVHQAAISVAVINAQGKLLMECVLETKAATIVEFIPRTAGNFGLDISSGGMGRVLERLGSREVSVNEFWPRVQSALSHSYHVMPPQITRDSHRPRASDRTMVDTFNHP